MTTLLYMFWFGDGGGGVAESVAYADVSARPQVQAEVRPLMGVLTKGVANTIPVLLKDENGDALTGQTGIVFYVVESTFEDLSTAPKIGDDSWSLTETATPGTYEGEMPYAAARLLNTKKTYRVVPYKDGLIEGANEVFTVVWS
jgi:hypothetical protein